MIIIFSRHAIVRMKERKILRNDVERAVKNPDNVYRSFADRIIFQKKIKKKALEVIIRKENHKIIILTCYWL